MNPTVAGNPSTTTSSLKQQEDTTVKACIQSERERGKRGFTRVSDCICEGSAFMLIAEGQYANTPTVGFSCDDHVGGLWAFNLF